jgi:hypothetical protein
VRKMMYLNSTRRAMPPIGEGWNLARLVVLRAAVALSPHSEGAQSGEGKRVAGERCPHLGGAQRVQDVGGIPTPEERSPRLAGAQTLKVGQVDERSGVGQLDELHVTG